MRRPVRISGLALFLGILFTAVFFGNSMNQSQASSLPSVGAADDTPALYDDKCAKCHGKDGRAKTMAGKMKHARDFTDVGWQDSISDEHLINSVTNGKEGMPAFGKKLTDAQITALVAYVRTFKGATKEK